MEHRNYANFYKAVVTLLAAGHFAAAQPSNILQTYSLNFVASEHSTCDAMASGLATRFEKSTGLRVVQSSCSDANPREAVVSISYFAEKPVAPHSTLLGVFPAGSATAVLGDFYQGVYPTIESCQANLPGQEATYARETGLTPVVAVCQRASFGGFGARIDGFGVAARAFINSGYGLEFSGTATMGFAARLKEALTRLGATSVAVVPLGSYLSAMYYASDALNLGVHRISGVGRVPEFTACQDQLAETESALATLGVPAVLAECLADSYDHEYAMNFVVRESSLQAGPVTIAGPLYASYEKCRDDRSRIAATVGQQAGAKIPLAICTRDRSATSPFRMTLFASKTGGDGAGYDVAE